MRKILAVAQIIVSCAFAVTITWIYSNSHIIRDKELTLQVADTFEAYSASLQHYQEIYQAFYDVLPQHRETLSDLRKITKSMPDNCEKLKTTADFIISAVIKVPGLPSSLTSAPLTKCVNGEIDKLKTFCINLDDALSGDIALLDTFTPEVHEKNLKTFSETDRMLQLGVQQLRDNANTPDVTAKLLLIAGYLLTLLFIFHAIAQYRLQNCNK